MDRSRLEDVCWDLILIYEQYLLDEVTPEALAAGFIVLLNVLPEPEIELDKYMDK